MLIRKDIKKRQKIDGPPGYTFLGDFLRKKSHIYEYRIMSRSNSIYVAIRFSSEGCIAMHIKKLRCSFQNEFL